MASRHHIKLSKTTRGECSATDEARARMTLIRNTRAEGLVCVCGVILSKPAFRGILPPSCANASNHPDDPSVYINR